MKLKIERVFSHRVYYFILKVYCHFVEQSGPGLKKNDFILWLQLKYKGLRALDAYDCGLSPSGNNY
jgi:hypothetical protein